MKSILLFASLLLSHLVYADGKPFSGSAEASAVVISGNSNIETYSAKTENAYTLTDSDQIKIFGKYVRSIATGIENAKAWEAGLRYEKVITKDELSAFFQHKAEHDPYNGVFIQRDSTDLGAKYTITKNDTLNWFAELGYQYTSTYGGPVVDKEYGGFIRGYSEASYKVSPTTSTKLWVEHLAPLKSELKSRSNAEFSLSVTMTDIFSLKTSYLFNHNEASAPPLKKDTTTWTTALVAKY